MINVHCLSDNLKMFPPVYFTNSLLWCENVHSGGSKYYWFVNETFILTILKTWLSKTKNEPKIFFNKSYIAIFYSLERNF